MGNRAVLSFGTTPKAPAIYLHWNGGLASVEAFLAAARALGMRHYRKQGARAAAEFVAIVARSFMGGSVYLETNETADCDNWDNGQFFVGQDMSIVRRKYRRGAEEIDAEKTAAIFAECIARAPHFNA